MPAMYDRNLDKQLVHDPLIEQANQLGKSKWLSVFAKL
jgi:hypothetical protein